MQIPKSPCNVNNKRILIVDDEPLVRGSLREMLSLCGYTVSIASNGREAADILKNFPADVVITDMRMPEMDGIHLLKYVKSEYPEMPVIMMTSFGSIDTAVSAMKMGAYDYITKPVIDSEIKLILERLINERNLEKENAKLKEQLSEVVKESFYDLVGKDEKMQNLYRLIEAVADTRATVLIRGESGTGKRLIAHAIHKHGSTGEQKKPFVEVSCGALTETLLESELFGHVKGAFTGAFKDRVGRFELANGGTMFLDEIDAFSPALQVKLLRVLQDGEFERVGDSKTLKVDVRILVATNQNLPDLIAQGKFRQDLFYRLNIISIEVPPLRERNGDICLLVQSFIKKHARHMNKKIESISPEAMQVLMNYSWPGNVRELENALERAAILSKTPVIQAHDLPDFLIHPKKQESDTAGGMQADSLSLKDALKNPERELIVKALNTADWNRNEAARLLGINRTTLYKKMATFGLLKEKRLNV
ncbi:MAG TPA: sigma-54 dependent transcriptional regulator [Candidatus Omnitrophota bacterium]|nr:sigma-54 dependent transcriptional regulator [Candidatus Omnitrophota bacterium]HPT08001.1 sigma-54 dependent transcriptional regulator [Candidatus Omnitrophota bacterium]